MRITVLHKVVKSESVDTEPGFSGSVIVSIRKETKVGRIPFRSVFIEKVHHIVED